MKKFISLTLAFAILTNILLPRVITTQVDALDTNFSKEYSITSDDMNQVTANDSLDSWMNYTRYNGSYTAMTKSSTGFDGTTAAYDGLDSANSAFSRYGDGLYSVIPPATSTNAATKAYIVPTSGNITVTLKVATSNANYYILDGGVMSVYKDSSEIETFNVKGTGTYSNGDMTKAEDIVKTYNLEVLAGQLLYFNYSNAGSSAYERGWIDVSVLYNASAGMTITINSDDMNQVTANDSLDSWMNYTRYNGSYTAMTKSSTGFDGTTAAYDGLDSANSAFSRYGDGLYSVIPPATSTNAATKAYIVPTSGNITVTLKVATSNANYYILDGGVMSVYKDSSAIETFDVKGSGTYSNGDMTKAEDIVKTYNIEVLAGQMLYFNYSNAGSSAYERGWIDVSVLYNHTGQYMPTDVDFLNPSSATANDGKITGTTTAMEYKLSTSGTYTAITGTEVTGLGVGIYKVRYKSTATLPASFDRELVLSVFSLDNPSGTPDFTTEEISFQKAEGTRIMNEINAAAANLNLSEYTIPCGDYGFAQTIWKNGTSNGFLLEGIVRPENNPFTIKAYGVTFWFDTMNTPAPTMGRAFYINKCENIVVKGLAVDSYKRNSIEGELSSIDVANNRLEITLLDGTLDDEATILAYNQYSGTQSRIIPIKPNGDLIVPLYNINDTWGPEYLFIDDITKSATGKYWLNLRDTGLLTTIFSTNWSNAYGSDGTLEIGDGICLLYGVMSGLSIDNSKQISLEDTNCYISKGSLWESGGYGNHSYTNVHLSPRPGTNQILGGGENMSAALRVGSTFDGCYFGLTSDDAINFHGFWGIAQSQNGNALTMDRVPSGLADGDLVEFYNIDTGALLYTYTISSLTRLSETDIHGNYYNTAITFTTTPNSLVVSSNSTIWARYTTTECGGWNIKNSIFDNNYQRILIQAGPGVFENNIVHCMGSGLDLFGNFYSLEGGFINNILIKNNVFIDSTTHPNGSPIQVNFSNKVTQTQWVTDINIQENAFIGAGDEAIKIVNAKNVTLAGNIITNPIRYTAISNPTMPRSSTAFTGTNVSNMTITNNLLFESTVYTSGNQFFNATATSAWNRANPDSSNSVQNAAYLAYADKENSAYDIYCATYYQAISKLVTGISLNASSITVAKNLTSQLTATITPSPVYNSSVTWTSSNSSIATVNSNGLVTGISPGTATITATTVDGGFSANCSVTVTRYDSTRYYKITYASSSTLAMDATTTGLNGVIKNVTYTGANSQQWQIIPTTDSSTFKIVNRATGYALKVNGTTNTTGIQIIQASYVSANNSNFTIADSGSYVQIFSKLGNKTYIKSTGSSGGTLVTAATATTTRWVITLLP